MSLPSALPPFVVASCARYSFRVSDSTLKANLLSEIEAINARGGGGVGSSGATGRGRKVSGRLLWHVLPARLRPDDPGNDRCDAMDTGLNEAQNANLRPC